MLTHAFVSGVSRVADFTAFKDARLPIGLSAQALSGPLEEHILRHYPRSWPLFLDSGAVNAARKGRALSPFEWMLILETYARFAKHFGDRLYLVAPDVVGSQEASLALIERFETTLSRLARLGCKVLIAYQPGTHSLRALHETLSARCPYPFVPAIPMLHYRRDLDALYDFLSARLCPQLHLLGLSPRARLYGPLSASLGDQPFSCDAALLPAIVGKRGTARPLTELEAWVALEHQRWLERTSPPQSSPLTPRFDKTEDLYQLTHWLDRRGQSEMVTYLKQAYPSESATLSQEDAKLTDKLEALILQLDDPYLDALLDTHYRRFADRCLGPERRYQALSHYLSLFELPYPRLPQEYPVPKLQQETHHHAA